MFKNNEREDSTSHRHSKSIPLLRNLSDSGNDLLPLTTFTTNKQINSTPYRRSISTSILPNSGDNFESTILHSRKRSDAHSIELQPLNENENLRWDSQVSTKITSGKDDRFGGHLYNDDNDIDDDGSRDNDSNNEEEHDDGENINDDNDDDINESDIYNKNKREDSLRTPLQNKFYYFFEEPLSNWAKAFETFSNLCTIANVVMICVVSWPTIYLSESQIYLNY
ncbi:hypothetical protein C1645_129401 [Glomus cerebriforme]|uniref:Ion transport domain-containing protein n=1 Tax=Glomus cerebriforme TaxID=658196 RepID=A0A397TTE1_9GLOM|nr:hypothetical protein C1645_129401 [Glomus cerebriforme]